MLKGLKLTIQMTIITNEALNLDKTLLQRHLTRTRTPSCPGNFALARQEMTSNHLSLNAGWILHHHRRHHHLLLRHHHHHLLRHHHHL